MDEVAAWKDKNLYDVIVGGTSSRDQPLIVMITTAGTVRESVYDMKYDEAERTLNGYDNPEHEDDEQFLPIIYELDDRKEWTDPLCWPKANPGLGTIKKLDQLRNKVKKAIANSMLVKNLLTKDFNIKETADSTWLTYDEAKNIATYDIEFLRGCYAVGGTDLSSTTDLSCATLLVMKPGDDTIYALQHYFLPDDLVEKRVKEDKIHYDKYIDKGWMTACAGNKVDYKDVTKWFVKMYKEFEIIPVWIGYDQWNAKYWVDEMQENGFTMEVVRQGAQTFSQPMKQMGADLAADRINYDNNQLTFWNLTNCSVVHDTNDNIRPIKQKSKGSD